ncbi:exonuclease domain-containing protein [Sphingomonas sp. H39-1-10]|uniref:exonuclease domain-containing protein n=1 Tax=Sphingomonas TaxID=13687 RepID=UPI000B89CFCC|nr:MULTISPECIES: exonuclease domain-containing protein [Sphingomonas]MDF0489628.1 exonuclease domain-containing protein [Sphingomonas pollutisoli]
MREIESARSAGPTFGDPPLDFVVVDVETACARVSSICQIGIVGFSGGEEVLNYESMVDPRDDFSPFNTRIHGISADHVAGKPCFGHIHSTVAAHLSGRITVAHSNFDKGALAAACRVHDRSPIKATWLDSVRVAKRAWPDLPSHRLNVLTKYLGIRHKHHDALSDARAAGLVVVRAIEHTGIDLAGWLAPYGTRGGAAPKAAKDGPLHGERVAILGAPRDGPLGRQLAEAGARVLSSVGLTTTMLVVSDEQPYGRFYHAAPAYRRAEELRRAGSSLAILSEAEIGRRLAAP